MVQLKWDESNGAVVGDGAKLCMPYWIRDIEGRLVKIETPREIELEVCLNIMDVPPEDQNSQHGQEDNFNAYRSMRDRMHPPPKENEKFYECWERYMEAINACPHHSFDTWLLVSYFYDEDRQCPIHNLKAYQPHTVQEKGKFPSQPHQNPKDIHDVEAQEGESSKVREVKAVITLRSGNRKGKSTKKDDHESSVDEEPERIVIKKDMMKNTCLHLSPSLHGKKGTNNASEIFEVLRQVKVNIPLLDMIKLVPTYAKFLKDCCTVKRGLNVNKKAFLTEQASAIIQCKSPMKYRDPGCPTISVSIGGTCVEKAFLDLGASVNLLPYSVYKQLGLGELKPTSITLSLADRSVKILRGMIEDVLVQELSHATQFGNMTLELNIFHLYKKHIHSEEEEGPEEVCMIDTLVEEHCDQRMQKDLLLPFIRRIVYLKSLEDAGIIYPISDSPWVSPTQVVPKKSRITVVQNDKGRRFLYTPHYKMEGVYRLQECLTGRSAFHGTQGIVLGHIISKQGIEVDKAKVELIVKLPSPTNVKGVRQFLGHGFYRRIEAISDNAPIVRAPNWQLPFEVMCDASDFAIGAVLGQREDGKPYVIYYASKTLNEAKKLHNHREKLLAVVFALDKFRAYLQDAKARLIRWILASRVQSPDQRQERKESLMLVEVAPWYAHIANYLVTGEVPRSVFLKKSKGILSHCHENACGGHFASQKTTMRVLQSGFCWPSLFKDAHTMCKSCDRCQRLGKLTRRNMMPLNPILIVDLFILQDHSWDVSLSPSLWQSMPSPLELEYKAWWAIKKLNMDLSSWVEELISRKDFQKDKESCSMTLSSTSFGQAEIKVDRSFYHSPSAFKWSSGTTQLQQHGSFKVNGHHLKPFVEPFSRDKEEFILLDQHQA
ncbi:hypothetical protein CK203_117244 [Vitis vinifera]|uniref:Retrovirus-related Pol polyprotein from transposon opus n=1 Tax=Vitis vinifera TaxID=29760 RepID=A0A438C8P7_VITVI|nr:hypothetical protein CK203_117244 [Vitis vinifera]